MTGDGADVAATEPFLLVAVTVTRSVVATSLAPSAYVVAVAEPSGLHALPDRSQRFH